MKIGDKVKILEYHFENKRYANYTIIEIYKKKYYNLYLVENCKTKIRTTFTDFDLKQKYRGIRKVEVL